MGSEKLCEAFEGLSQSENESQDDDDREGVIQDDPDLAEQKAIYCETIGEMSMRQDGLRVAPEECEGEGVTYESLSLANQETRDAKCGGGGRAEMFGGGSDSQ